MVNRFATLLITLFSSSLFASYADVNCKKITLDIFDSSVNSQICVQFISNTNVYKKPGYKTNEVRLIAPTIQYSHHLPTQLASSRANAKFICRAFGYNEGIITDDTAYHSLVAKIKLDEKVGSLKVSRFLVTPSQRVIAVVKCQ